MAYLATSLAAPAITGRVVYAVTSTAKSSAGAGGESKEEKGLWDFILGGLQKQDQMYETDPLLKKVEEKTGTTTGTAASNGGGRKNSVAVPRKKKIGGGGAFGGLFAKK